MNRSKSKQPKQRLQEKQEMLPLEGLEPAKPSFALGPYITAYAKAYKFPLSSQAIGRMAREVKKLEEEHGHELIYNAYTSYLDSTPAQYYSFFRFTETLPAWTGAAPMSSSRRNSTDPLPGETVDAYIARVGGGK